MLPYVQLSDATPSTVFPEALTFDDGSPFAAADDGNCSARQSHWYGRVNVSRLSCAKEEMLHFEKTNDNSMCTVLQVEWIAKIYLDSSWLLNMSYIWVMGTVSCTI